MNSVI